MGDKRDQQVSEQKEYQREYLSTCVLICQKKKILIPFSIVKDNCEKKKLFLNAYSLQLSYIEILFAISDHFLNFIFRSVWFSQARGVDAGMCIGNIWGDF